MAQTTRTIDHDEIQQWASVHGGAPAILADSRVGESGMLRLDFGEGTEALERITWADFFDIFDENDLAFVYEFDINGDASMRYHFVSRTPEDELGSLDDEMGQDGITDSATW